MDNNGEYGVFYSYIPNSLININISSICNVINYQAFCWLSSLQTLNIANGVTTIGEYAFSDCIGLENVTIPNSVTSIKSGVFNGCTILVSVSLKTLAGNNVIIDADVFSTSVINIDFNGRTWTNGETVYSNSNLPTNASLLNGKTWVIS